MGEFQGRGSLVGCRLWGRTESDATEVTLAAAAAMHVYAGLVEIVEVKDIWLLILLKLFSLG